MKKFNLGNLFRIIGLEWLISYGFFACAIFVDEVIDHSFERAIEEMVDFFTDMENIMLMDLGLMLLGTITLGIFGIGYLVEKRQIRKKIDNITSLKKEAA